MKPLLIVTLLALPLPALAETREERVAVATEYVDLALQGFDMGAVIETMERLGRGGEPPGLRAARSVLGALRR